LQFENDTTSSLRDRAINAFVDYIDLTATFVMRMLGAVGRFILHSVFVRGIEWNILRPDATLYGQKNSKFWHGFTISLLAHILFALAFYLPMMLRGCDYYYLPAGGGGGSMAGGSRQQEIIRIIKKKKQKQVKFVTNKFSPIKFTVPKIDDAAREKVDEKLEEFSNLQYKAGAEGHGEGTENGDGPGSGMLGRGSGDGAGFGVGRGNGVVRWIRLKYDGGNWDSNMGKGADYNLLLEVHVRTAAGSSRGWKVADKSEYKEIDGLNSFPKYASPPIVYITGAKDLNTSSREDATLRRYLVDRHGMIFADASSPGWAQHFRRLMSRVLPDVKPVEIPLDDEIFQAPYHLRSFPFTSPHERPTVPWGWKVQGRWVAFLHPGDIGDAWKDGHSGIEPSVVEGSYRLGLNVLYYSMNKYAAWLEENKVHQ